MGVAKKLIDKKALRDLVPINALSSTHIEEISKKAVIADVRSGRFVFKKGDRDYQSVYLLEGKIELIGDKGDVVTQVIAGSDAARHPLAHKQPRQLSARAVGNVTIACVDSSLLDVLLTWDESAGYDVVEIDAQDDDDWMTRMLQSQAFLQLPPSNIHQLLMRLETTSARAGDVIVRQGDEGDYFYIVKSGRLAVTRKASPRGKDVVLAELSEGACFGEEALVSDTERNASVTMITDGDLMRLSKQDFRELLCTSLVHEIDFARARELASQGAQLLDVRLPGEFDNQAIKGSRNLPLSALRDESAQLDANTTYVVCCDTGRRSAAGAFLLSQRGFNVYTLKKGLMDAPEEMLTPTTDGTSSGVDKTVRDADIIPFEADIREAAEQASGAASSDLGASAPAVGGPDSDRAVEGDLRAQLKQLQQQLGEAQAQLVDADAQRDEERAISERVMLQVESLEADLQRLRSEREALEERLQNGEAARESSSELEDQLAELKKFQEAHDKRSRKLDQELAQVREDYRQLGQRASALGGERDAAVKDLQKARGDIDALKQQLSSRQGEVSDQIQTLEKLLEQRDREIDEAKNQHRHLEQQLEERGLAHQTLEQAFEALKQQADAQTSEKAGLVSGLEATKQQLGELEALLKAAGERERSLQEQIEDLDKTSREALAQLRSEASDQQQELDKKIADLRVELDDKVQQLEAEQSRQDGLEQKLAEAGKEIEKAHLQAQEQLAQAQEAEHSAKASIERIRSEASIERDALNQQLNDLRTELDEKIRLYEEQSSSHSELQQKLAELEQEQEAASRREQSLQEQLQQTEKQAEESRHALEQTTQRTGELEQQLTESQRQRSDSDNRVKELETRVKDLSKEYESDIASVRGALARAQDERENVMRDQKRLMDSLRKAESSLAQARQDHDTEVYRLRKELKESAGEDSSGLAAELEALQEQLKEHAQQREELELNLGSRSEQFENAQLQVERLTQQLVQAQDSARQAEQQLVEANQAADQEMAVRLQAEQESRQALRDELDKAILERDTHQERLTVLVQEAEELRSALSDQASVRAEVAESQSQLDELRERLQQAEAERDQVRESEQQLRQETDQLRAEAEVTRGLVDMAPGGDGDVAIREELVAVKKNVEVAVRLRGQAEEKVAELEQQVVRLEAELARTQAQVSDGVATARIPSLDANDPQASVILNPEIFDQEQDPGGDAGTTPAASVLPDTACAVGNGTREKDFADRAENTTRGAWKSAVGGVLIGALAAAAGMWWLNGQSLTVILPSSEQVSEPNPPATVPEPVEPVSAATPKPKVQPNAKSPVAWGLPEVTESVPDSVMKSPAVEQADDVQPAVPERAPDALSNAADESIPLVPQPAGYFRDRLSSGEAGPAMVEFNADRFSMGSGPASPNFDERPRHEVQLKRFAISRYETTFEEYDRFALDTGRARPNDMGWGRGKRPVVNISWRDATAYADWLSRQTGRRYRLPTEAEWEFVARASSGKRFWWGNEVGEARASCFDCASPSAGQSTVAVGSFEPSGYGVYDMAGNAREWLHDCYVANYMEAPRDGSAVEFTGCADRVVRGGGFSSPSDKLRSTARDASAPQSRLNDLGFRVVRDY